MVDLPLSHSERLLETPLSEIAIQRTVGATSMVRGRQYVSQRRVLNAEFVSDTRLLAQVSGTRLHPYNQTIDFRKKDGRLVIAGVCSCPMDSNCKHVAAVLLKLLREREALLKSRQGMPPITESAEELSEAGPLTEAIAEKVAPAVSLWILDGLKVLQPPAEELENLSSKVAYLLNYQGLLGRRNGLVIAVGGLKLLQSGQASSFVVAKQHAIRSGSFAQYWRQTDRELVKRLMKVGDLLNSQDMEFGLSDRAGEDLMLDIIETGRCYWQQPAEKAITLSPARKGLPNWAMDSDGVQRFEFNVEEGGKGFSVAGLWYVDPATSEIGRLETETGTDFAKQMLRAPVIVPEDAHEAHRLFLEAFPAFERLAPTPLQPPKRMRMQPTPVLSIRKGRARKSRSKRYYYSVGPYDMVLVTAKLGFRYGSSVAYQGSENLAIRSRSDDQVLFYERDFGFEELSAERLLEVGWTKYPLVFELEDPESYCLEDEFAANALNEPIHEFLREGALELVAEGWVLDIEPALQVHIVPAGEIEIQFEGDGSNPWFEIQMGMRVGDETIDLATLFAQLFRKLSEHGITKLDQFTDQTFLHQMDDGRILSVPLAKIKEPLRVLLEIYGPPNEWRDLKKLPKWRALDILALTESNITARCNERLKELANDLRQSNGIQRVCAPKLFKGALRPYQEEGLSWLQFLARFELGGILADDMGLGKTVQALAHLLWEKERGVYNKPVLLVAPTSVVPNWAVEAEKFAPSLKVLVLHGKERKDSFDRIQDYDLVLTTYALLVRDSKALLNHSYHALILDEAQFIKNSRTNASSIARQVPAGHRICLTGTPIENHLGELWSIMEVVLPGHLGSETSFRSRFRNPIEKLNAASPRNELARRIKPFVLRRTKEDVDLQLPPKTEIVRYVEFESDQRALYETMRCAMDTRVRNALKQKGLAKSHIIVLDALLKLRQICCDPRLVKLPRAKDVKGSAKLEAVIEMVRTLVDEGRRILLFSQFTSMLDLIEPKLREENIEFVKIVGETVDRATPVKRFQASQIPLFLISLKAGGTGLNLTAADTVIHYDPWWNPAVERQATDRAHRIGQTKPVIVYKMVAQNTVEEKIVELQQKKGELAAALLDGESTKIDITAEDIAMLFGS